MRVRVLAAAMLLSCVVFPAFSITYLVPSDRDLIDRSEGIVIATASESHALVEGERVVTAATFRVERVVKGGIDASAELRLVEPGGAVGSMASVIPGSPRYRDGERYLLFLRHTANGDWASYGFGLGKFTYVSDFRGRELVVRGSVEDDLGGFDEGSEAEHREPLRDADAFIAYVEHVVAGRESIANADYFIDRGSLLLASDFGPAGKFPIASNATRPDYLLSGNYRWQNGGVATWVYCCASLGAQPGLDGPAAFSSACNKWSNAGATVHYTPNGNDEAATAGLEGLGSGHHDNKNAVLFGDPNGDFAAAGVPAGVAGLGGISRAGASYSLADGFSYSNILEGDVVIARNLSISQATFVGVVTHELGHTLGFRHSNQNAAGNGPCAPGAPCTTNAIMNSVIAAGLSSLQQYDLDAVQTVYGSGPVCTPPSITTPPASKTITAGASTTLSVAATGTAPLTYVWYVGNAGDTSTPAGTASSINVSPATTTSYWVRVTGQCAPVADSSTVTVTVNPATSCPTVVVSTPQATAQGGTAYSLTANATGGTGITYQWFQGNNPGSGSPIGSGNPITVNPTITTTYWVRAANDCGNHTDSATVTVVVTPVCNLPSITQQPQNQSIVAGGTASLVVGYSGTSPVTITWYQGALGDRSTPVGNGALFNSAPLASTTTFWVEVTNGCGAAQSRLVTVNVTATCTAPAITSATATPSTVTVGQPVTLNVVATGTSLSYQWYRGAVGDTSAPLDGGTTPTVTITPAATATYWVRVTSGCGAAPVDSAAVPVTVGACAPPAIVTQPLSQTLVGPTSVTLTVEATNATHYAWFAGEPGDTTTPVGTDSATLTTNVLTATTSSFWVRVSNDCGPTNSNAAVITLVPHRRRAAGH